MASLLKSVNIDFVAVENEMEKRGERIDWFYAGTDWKPEFYKFVNEASVELFENGTYGKDGLMDAIIKIIHDYCDECEMYIIKLDEDEKLA